VSLFAPEVEKGGSEMMMNTSGGAIAPAMHRTGAVSFGAFSGTRRHG